MTDYRRFAIYFIPKTGSSLQKFGDKWLDIVQPNAFPITKMFFGLTIDVMHCRNINSTIDKPPPLHILFPLFKI